MAPRPESPQTPQQQKKLEICKSVRESPRVSIASLKVNVDHSPKKKVNVESPKVDAKSPKANLDSHGQSF